MTPSTVILDRMSGQSKAFSNGFGNASPLVSITMWSGRGSKAIKASMVGMKSSATVQQMHPLASSMMFSAGQSGMAQLFKISPSTPTSPNSLTTIANRLPPGFCINSRIKVVFPEPRKPVTTVTGNLARSVIHQTPKAGCAQRSCA